MADAAPLSMERVGDVAVLTLDRPDHGNALDETLARALLDQAIACATDPAIRAVLLRARGRFFCVGGDVRAFGAAGDGTPALLLRITALLHAAVSRFARMDKPLVTEVQGFAAGGGFGLAMLGDIVVASTAAQFTLSYNGIGLTPDCGASWLLPRLIGMRRAQEMMLLDIRLDARAALDVGLVTQIADDAALSGRAMAIAQRLARGPTRSLGKARSLLLSTFANAFEAHLEEESRFIAASSSTPDGREGIRAFLAKRTPLFTGA